MNIYFYLIIFISSITDLSGGIDNHLKKVTDKIGVHQIRNIDFIYMINLDQRPEKYQSCLKQLAPHGIVPYRFSAVNGWQLSNEEINDLGIRLEPWMLKGFMGTSYVPDRNGNPTRVDEIIHQIGKCYFHYRVARGTIGIVLSHLSVLQDALSSGYETIWVMEDDIEVVQNPHILSERIEQLDQCIGKDNWDILFTDLDTKNEKGEYVICLSYANRPNFVPRDTSRFAIREDISHHFRKIGARYGAYSMILRRSGVEKIFNFIREYHIFLPYDMDYYLPNNMKIYTLREDIVSTQPQALSDNARPGYTAKYIEFYHKIGTNND